MKNFLEYYNKLFLFLLGMMLIGLTVYGVYLHFQKNENFYYFRVVVKREIEKVIVQVLITIVMVLGMREAFKIDISYYIDVDVWWRIILGGCIVWRLKSGNRFYRRLQRLRERRRVKSGEYNFLSPEKILVHEIEWWEAEYELQGKRMEILKSLTPLSILPLIAGYILEGKDLIVDWKWCIGIYLFGVAMYIYFLWKCYYDMRESMRKKSECRHDLLEVEYEREKGDDSTIKIIEDGR